MRDTKETTEMVESARVLSIDFITQIMNYAEDLEKNGYGKYITMNTMTVMTLFLASVLYSHFDTEEERLKAFEVLKNLVLQQVQVLDMEETVEVRPTMPFGRN